MARNVRGLALLSVVRRGAVMLTGVFVLCLSIGQLGKPPQDVERTGWLYQHYGAQGVHYSMIALTVAFTLFAGAMTWRAWSAYARSRQPRS